MVCMLCLCIPAHADEQIRESKILTPDDLGITKFELHQASDKENVAVIRHEHLIQGKLYDAADHVYYTPDKPMLGSILVFPDKRTKVIYPAGSEQLIFDDDFTGITFQSTKVVAPDGKEYPASLVTFNARREEIRIYVYQAPMKVFKSAIPDLPEPKDGTAFMNWVRPIMIGGSTSVTRINDGPEEIEFEATPPDPTVE